MIRRWHARIVQWSEQSDEQIRGVLEEYAWHLVWLMRIQCEYRTIF